MHEEAAKPILGAKGRTERNGCKARHEVRGKKT